MTDDLTLVWLSASISRAISCLPSWLVPGAWLGGWCWRYVAADLRAAGHSVICATLTGLGENVRIC